MPKIFNTSWLAVILATVAFFMIGFLWYGFLFEAAWLEAAKITSAEAEAMMTEKGPIAMVFALLVTLGQAIGVLMVLHLAGAKRLTTCLNTAFWLCVTIVGPILAYANIYGDLSLTGFLIDFSHLTLGYLVMAAIYSIFRSKEAVES